MPRARIITATLLSLALAFLSLTAQAQRRRPSAPAPRRTPPPTKTTTTKTATKTPATTAADARMTGLYRLDAAASDDPLLAATRAARILPQGDERRRVVDDLTARLTSPEQLTIARRGKNISIASTRAPRIDFEADGRTRTEPSASGNIVRTKAALYGDQLMISSEGSPDDQFSVFFDSVEQGRRLRVTRRIYDAQLGQPILVRSFYNKTSGVARFSIYGEPESSPASTAADDRRTTRDAPAQSARTTNQEVRRQTPARPVFRPAPPTPRRDPREEVFTIGTNAQFVATLNDDLSTATSREGDRFTLTVREPAAFAGATIEGTVARIRRGGRISGRSEMTLNFERIRLGDGRTAEFTAAVESVRPAGGEEVRVDNESNGGEVQEGDSQTDRTTERAALGAAVGAIIGAISGGGKGAAIGAVIGAGAGAGSVYAQGRDDLELRRGSELVVRTTMR